MNIEPARELMINHQVRPWNVFDDRILDALASVQRERYAPAEYRRLAFADTFIPLPCGQCMLKPVLEGRLLQALDPEPGHAALVVGTGSGFLAGCVARLAGQVVAIDIHAELTEAASERLREDHFHNIELATVGLMDYEPGRRFDRILLTGSMPLFEERLVEWLRPGGRMVLTVGEPPAMQVLAVDREESAYQRQILFETVIPRFEHVPEPSAFRF